MPTTRSRPKPKRKAPSYTESESNGDVLSDSPISIDSDFYGTPEIRREYSHRDQAEVTDEHIHGWNVQVLAARAIQRNPGLWIVRGEKRKREVEETKSEDVKKSKIESGPSTVSVRLSRREKALEPRNPYQDLDAALQIHESVDDFLRRLKPSSDEIREPWLYCANFQAGDRSMKSDVARFKQVGNRLLEQHLAKRRQLENKFDPPKSEGAITRMMGADRTRLEAEIMAAAKKYGVTSGKWMLFPSIDKVDRYWAAVVRGTVEGRLGSCAKVATKPDKPDEPTRVICVYTEAMTDTEDIKRVLSELVELQLVPGVHAERPKKTGGKGQIWYKPDCYTYLDIVSGNEYKIKPTLYGSGSLLTPNDV